MEEVVLCDDFLWDYFQADFYILVMTHGGIVIKILNFQSDEAVTRGGDSAVQKAFFRR